MFEGGTQLGLKSGELAALTLSRAARSPKPQAEDINTISLHERLPSHPGTLPDDEPLSPGSEAPLHKPPTGLLPTTPFSDPFNAHALSEYENLWRSEFPPYEKLLKGKHHMYGFTDKELNTLSRILPKDLTHISGVDKAIIAAKLALNPGLLKKNVLSALDTFSYSTGPQYGW
jgi:hypothetical protein